jgi:hypothetical protein
MTDAVHAVDATNGSALVHDIEIVRPAAAVRPNETLKRHCAAMLEWRDWADIGALRT